MSETYWRSNAVQTIWCKLCWKNHQKWAKTAKSLNFKFDFQQEMHLQKSIKCRWHASIYLNSILLSLLLINSLGCQGCLRPTAHRRKWCMPFWNCWLMGALNNWVFFNFIVFFKNAEGKKNPSFWHRTGIPITYQRSRLCRVFAVPRPSKAMHDTILDSSTHKE